MGMRRCKTKIRDGLFRTVIWLAFLMASLIMSLQSGTGVVFAANSNDFPVKGSIKIDTTKYAITIPANKEKVYYSIKPEISAYYTFELSDYGNESVMMYFYDSDKKAIGYGTSGSRKSAFLQKDTQYYLGIVNSTSKEYSIDCNIRGYSNLSNYVKKLPSKIYVKNGVVNPDDYSKDLYYVSNGTSYAANCTLKYTKYVNEDSSYFSNITGEGFPTEVGKFYLTWTPSVPFEGTYNSTIYIYDDSDFEKYLKNAKEINGYYKGYDNGCDEYFYTGKAFDPKNIIFSSDKKELELGRDYTFDGYCSYNAYNTINPESIKWKSGTPKEPGRYYLMFSGKGSLKGTVYYPISIIKAVNLSYLKYIDIKKETQTLEESETGAKVYRIKPSKTGQYTISLSREDGYPVYATLFNKNAAIIDAEEDSYNNTGDIKLEANLTQGEDYYLRVSVPAYYYAFLNQYKATLSIPGYSFYVPPKTDTTTNKKNEQSGKTAQSGNKTQQSSTTNKTQQSDSTDKAQQTVNKTEQPDSTSKTDTNKNNTATTTAKSKSKALAKGKTFKSGGLTYKVTSSKKGKYKVTLVKNNKKNATKITVKNSVKYKGITYKITAIGSKAFRNNKKLKTLSFGKYITKVEKNAFKGCKKLKTVKVPKNKLKKYKKLLKGAGLSKKVNVLAK